jgi:hypothetical protein
MKKFLIVLMSVMLFGGCSYLNGFLCNPTAKQTEAANVGKAVVSTLLVAAVVYSGGNEVVSLLNQNAIPVFEKVVQGYCVAQSEWDTAVAAVELAANKTNEIAAASQPFKAKPTPVVDVTNAIDIIKPVRW